MSTTNVGTLMRMAAARDRTAGAGRGRSSRVSTWRSYSLVVGKVLPDSIGVKLGGTESYVDPRDGRACLRERLAFLSRRHVAVIQGLLREGETIVVDVPDWLAERVGLDKGKAGAP